MKCINLWEAPHHTPDQAESFTWILDQNLKAHQEEEAAGLVENLQEEVEALKGHRRHLQRQMPKPKKKPKKVGFNCGKQKNKYTKPQPTETSQPGQAEEAQMEVLHNNNNNKRRRNQRNRQRKMLNKNMANLKKRNDNSDPNQREFHCTFSDAHS